MSRSDGGPARPSYMLPDAVWTALRELEAATVDETRAARDPAVSRAEYEAAMLRREVARDALATALFAEGLPLHPLYARQPAP